jgi:DNA-binding NarL/FixJ family response regulator
MRIVVASSDSSAGKAIGMLIDAQSDLEMAGQFADIADLLLEVKQAQPDLIVLDWEAFGMRIDTLRELLGLFQRPPAIVALSIDQQARNTAFDSGVVGFAYKGDSPEHLLSAIRAARQGRITGGKVDFVLRNQSAE